MTTDQRGRPEPPGVDGGGSIRTPGTGNHQVCRSTSGAAGLSISMGNSSCR
jgi:hypothetical protein